MKSANSSFGNDLRAEENSLKITFIRPILPMAHRSANTRDNPGNAGFHPESQSTGETSDAKAIITHRHGRQFPFCTICNSGEFCPGANACRKGEQLIFDYPRERGVSIGKTWSGRTAAFSPDDIRGIPSH